MTREELERRLDEAEKQNLGLLDEIKWLKEKLAEQDKQEIPEYPKFIIEDVSYWMDAEFRVRHSIEGDKPDADYNLFHTERYVKEFADKCKLLAMLLHCKWYVDRDYTPDWNNEDEEKWQVFWGNTYKKYEVCGWESDEYSSVYFSTEEAAQKCADWMNEHWKEET